MTGCDCGGNTHNEEHANDCAGWRLEVERLREALRDVAERQREACAQVAAQMVEPVAVGGYGRHLVDDTLDAVRNTPLVTKD